MVINVELPVLVLLAALLCALTVWLVGTFTRHLRGHRYRISLGILAFALSGFMGFLCVLRLETIVFPEWISTQPVFVPLGIGYLGYVLFGFLGCWTAVRIAAQLDRKHTLSVLYSLVEKRKHPDAG